MVNYVVENGVRVPALYAEEVRSGVSNLEKALQDAASPMGLSVEPDGDSDKLTASRYRLTKPVSETIEKGFFKKRSVTSTKKVDVGTMYIGLIPISNGVTAVPGKCPIYLVNAAPYHPYGSFLDVSGRWITDEERSDNFKLLKKLGMEIHNKLGNDVVLETEHTWNTTAGEGFKSGGEQLRTCEYCGFGAFAGKSCEHCGAPA